MKVSRRGAEAQRGGECFSMFLLEPPHPNSNWNEVWLMLLKMKGESLPPKMLVGLAKFVWTTLWKLMMSQLAPSNKEGEYVRPASQFRGEIGTEDGFPPEMRRYRLYVGLGCPWAHRTLVVRALKGLEEVISVTIASPSGEEGIWVLEGDKEGCRSLPELYQLAQRGYTGRCTVPVLWDTSCKKIVNNESGDIIVLLNSQFNRFAKNPGLDLYPVELREKIDFWNEKIYHGVNNGVYRCGFAQTQTAYDKACDELFATLDEIDAVLARNRYICGSEVTLADVRLFTTLFRFDVVYYGLFKCDRRRIQDYHNLGPYLRDMYQLPGVQDTCSLEEVKKDYYGNLFPLNPGGIIPSGPDIKNLRLPHGRGGKGTAADNR